MSSAADMIGALLFACWVILHAFLSPVDFFFLKFTFSKTIIRNTIRVSNSLDPDQAQRLSGQIWVQTGPTFVGPDLGPICLQRLSPDDKSRH